MFTLNDASYREPNPSYCRAPNSKLPVTIARLAVAAAAAGIFAAASAAAVAAAAAAAVAAATAAG